MAKANCEMVDIESVKADIEVSLFGPQVQFSRARSLILNNWPSAESLGEWADRYYELHKGEKRRQGEIAYLYLVSTKGDASKINDIALRLLQKSEKDNIGIAVSLFREASRLGNAYAAASYLYCLLNGCGVRKNLKEAASVYYDYEAKGIVLGNAFASQALPGKPFEIPRDVVIPRINTAVTSFVAKITSLLRVVPALPKEYWAYRVEKATREEADFIKKNPSAYGDGPFEGPYKGCEEGCVGDSRLLNIYIFLPVLVVSIIAAMVTGHVPNRLLGIIAFALFCPSALGLEGKVTICYVALAALAMLYFVFCMFADFCEFDILLLMCLGAAFFFGVFGFWFHYLCAIEWKYGSAKAFLFSLATLVPLAGLCLLLYHYGIIL